MVSCSEKIKEPTKEDKINVIAAPLIADEVGDLNILLSKAKDENISISYRSLAIDKIRAKFIDYLSWVSLANINSQEIKDRIELQKTLIESKWTDYATEVVYKQLLEKNYEK